MRLSQLMQTNIAGWFTGTNMPAAPSSLKIVLSSTDPCVALTEVGTRQTIAFADVAGVQRNPVPVVFNDAAGSVTHAAIADGTTGDILLCGPLDIPRVIPAGDNFPFSTNEVSIVFDNLFAPDFAVMMYAWLNGTNFPAAPVMYAEISRGEVFNPPATTDGYARQPIVFVTPLPYTAGIGTTLENADNVLFPSSNTNNWGTITHLFIGDGTNVYLKARLSIAKNVEIGGSVGFADNSFRLVIG